jgi:glycosyltransferase involved in cell wall biosynthesis
VVAGHGSRAADLRREASRLAAGNPRLAVEFPGWLTDETRADALRDADLLLVPSVWPEPFGMVGVEAAAAGVPAVAFDVGGIRDWLRDGVAGRLVPLDRDPVRRFADAIVRTLSDSAALGEMRRQARISAARFTMAAHLDALEPILRELAARRADRAEAHRSA